MIKKTAILLLTLLILAGLGIAVHHYATIPREEGIAYLSPEKMELYSPLSTYASSFANYQREKPDELVDLPKAISDNLSNQTLFFELPVGKQRVFAIIHKPSDDTAMGWIDTDMDNCLSDEKALSGIPENPERVNSPGNILISATSN